MKIPAIHRPWKKSQMATGTQTSPVPRMGISEKRMEKKAMSAAHARAFGSPTIAKAASPSAP